MSEQNELVVYDAEVQMVEQRRFMPVMALSTAVARRQTIVDATTALMKEGVDYGKIPGANRDCLLQPGADKLCNLFGLVIKYEILEQVQDWTGVDHGGEPFFYMFVKGRAYRGEECMGEGIGSCSSWESKYRYRNSERQCPSCGKAAIIKGKEEYGGGYVCFAKKGGCGAKYKDGDPAIESQSVGRKVNPDIYDILNTVQKIAFKRCKVSTTINATSASEFFTQDVEDNPPPQEEHNPAAQTKEKTAAAKKSEWAKGKAAAQEVAERKIQELERSKLTPVQILAVVDPMNPLAEPPIGDDDLPLELGGTYVAPPNPAEQMKAKAKEALAPRTLAQNLEDSINQVNARKAAEKSKDYNMLQHFGVQKKRFQSLKAEHLYYKILGVHGVEHANEFPDTVEGKKAGRECYRDMQIQLGDMEAQARSATMHIGLERQLDDGFLQDERQALSE